MSDQNLQRYVIGVDVGGTNTDAVLMQGDTVVAWHKTPTTRDVVAGVSLSIKEALDKAHIEASSVSLVKIGTTQFINAILETDPRKLDRVAVIRLCGPYTRSVKPFLAFPPRLRGLVEGHHAYLNGGYHVDGREILPWCPSQLREQAALVKSKNLTSVVVIGVHSPSFPAQETEAAAFLTRELEGAGVDVTCSHELASSGGGFLERENTAVLNASIRRFAGRVIRALFDATRFLGGLGARTFVTLNDGTVSPASHAVRYPLKCFASGPTNSARGAAFLGREILAGRREGEDVLVIDVGGTTTDVCSLLPNGYPKRLAAFVRISGVKTSLSTPDIHSVTLGGGSVIRSADDGRSAVVGPDSVAADELTESLAADGATFTASDLAKLDDAELRRNNISADLIKSARDVIRRRVEEAIDRAKTKPDDARVIFVGGGSFILPDSLKGVGALIQPSCFQVANAVGAAIAKVSGRVDRMIVPGTRSLESIIEDGKREAIELCCNKGGVKEAAEIVDLEVIPETYTDDGAFRLIVRAVSDIGNIDLVSQADVDDWHMSPHVTDSPPDSISYHGLDIIGGEQDSAAKLNISTYKPHIENDIWTLSELDIEFLMDGTAIMGCGCTGEETNYLLSLKEAIQNGEKVRVSSLRGVKPDDVICPTCWMGSPTAFFERVPSGEEMQEAIFANLEQIGKSDFTHTIPSEIGGPNALEALLVAAKLGKIAVDADLEGRAFPRVYMTVPGVHGKTVVPAAMADGNGALAVLKKAKDDFQAETILRCLTGQLGGIASLALQPFMGTEKHLFAQNSYSIAWLIGRNIRLAQQSKTDVASSLVTACSGNVLYRGKINIVSRRVHNSFTRGTCTILPETADEEEGFLELVFENEILAAVLKSGDDAETCLAVTPDLIAILDSATGQAIGITEVRYGLHVVVIALRAPEIWYTPAGLSRAGPLTFGLPDWRGVALKPTSTPPSIFDMYGDSS